jgi:hypothetical protein
MSTTDQEDVRAGPPHRLRDRPQIVGDPGRGLVVRDADGPHVGELIQPAADLCRVRAPPPWDLQLVNAQLEALGQLSEAPAEHADRDDKDGIAG